MTLITFASIIFSILVVSTSTVFSVLWLVGTFIIISLMLGLLNLGFPALIYVIVYVGAIAILFLFVIQLLDSESMANYKQVANNSLTKFTQPVLGPLAIVFSLGMMSIGVTISNAYSQNSLFQAAKSVTMEGNLLNNTYSSLFDMETTLNLIDYFTAKTGKSSQVESFAEWLYGPGLLPLIIVSVVLLVAMIAPIYLCKED